MKRLGLTLLLGTTLLLPPLLAQQAAPGNAPAANKANGRVHVPNEEYNTAEKRANIAGRLDSVDREKRLNPAAVVAALGIRPGDRVADIGTGTGILLAHLSRAVGPAGVVYAEDIFPDFLQRARTRAEGQDLQNVVFVLGGERHPGLPPAQMDLAIMMDSYHHFEYPRTMLDGIRAALKPEGRIAIIDYQKQGGMASHVRLARDEVVKEVEGFGWKFESSPQVSTDQYILVFRRPPS